MTSHLSDMKLSIVTTLYNSGAFVENFYTRMKAEAEKITGDFEIIFVDDGSPDDSLNRALALLSADHRVKVVELSRNFGHHKAMMTGLENASGQSVFLIDVDLEEPPELLGRFYKHMWENNWDVVYGYQEQRKGNLFEQWSGAVAWSLIDVLIPAKIPRNHSTVRLMKGYYVRALVRHQEHKTAIGGLWVQTGFKQTGLQFEKQSRHGSSYHFSSRLLAFLDSVTSFSERPLFFVFFAGAAIFCLSTLISTALFILWLVGKTLPGWISVMASVWLLGGFIILSVGIVGLYISRIFIETKLRPYTIIRHIHQDGERSGG